MLHEPTRGLGAKEDPNEEDEGWDEGRTELETPSDGTNVFDNDVGAEAQEDTCGRQSASVSRRATKGRQLTDHDPKLPEHDEGTSNSSRGYLGRVDGDRGVLCTDTDTHDKSRREQSFP